MKRLGRDIESDVEQIIEFIESGEELCVELENGKKYILSRAITNNKYATMQNCEDGEIDTFHIVSETESLFTNAKFYTDFRISICVE